MTGTRLLVIDTDLALGELGAKVDDGCALALALASPELDVGLVTTVAGNVDVPTATTRTTALLARLGRSDIAVVPGGEPDGGGAARAIAAWALDTPGELTVVALGPASNVAAALAADPAVAGALREVVVMGGRFLGRGPAEFNARTDPWAMRAMLESGVHTRLVGLDVTWRMALTPEEVDRLGTGSATAAYLARHIRARLALLAREGIGACPMHDPLAVLALTHPELLTWRAAEVTVRTGETAQRGRTRATFLDDGAARLSMCDVATAVDAGAARALLLNRLMAVP
jgi:purine nucleosidase